MMVTGTTVADFNKDGDVDTLDLAIWEANYGTALGASMGIGDANGDRAVNGADFMAWQRQFIGSQAVKNGASAQVPEPNSWAMFILALALFVIRP